MRITGALIACIVEQAQRMAAEYIVIGSHGHTAAYNIVMASGVLKKARCPVLIVPSVSAEAALNTQTALVSEKS
jgi:nucleotide-binding universal stress UspA family protein